MKLDDISVFSLGLCIAAGVEGLSAHRAGECLHTAHSFKILARAKSQFPHMRGPSGRRIQKTFPPTWAPWVDFGRKNTNRDRQRSSVIYGGNPVAWPSQRSQRSPYEASDQIVSNLGPLTGLPCLFLWNVSYICSVYMYCIWYLYIYIYVCVCVCAWTLICIYGVVYSITHCEIAYVFIAWVTWLPAMISSISFQSIFFGWSLMHSCGAHCGAR